MKFKFIFILFKQRQREDIKNIKIRYEILLVAITEENPKLSINNQQVLLANVLDISATLVHQALD